MMNPTMKNSHTMRVSHTPVVQPLAAMPQKKKDESLQYEESSSKTPIFPSSVVFAKPINNIPSQVASGILPGREILGNITNQQRNSFHSNNNVMSKPSTSTSCCTMTHTTHSLCKDSANGKTDAVQSNTEREQPKPPVRREPIVQSPTYPINQGQNMEDENSESIQNSDNFTCFELTDDMQDEESDDSSDAGSYYEEPLTAPPNTVDLDLYSQSDRERLQAILHNRLMNPKNTLPKPSSTQEHYQHLPLLDEQEILNFLFSAQYSKQANPSYLENNIVTANYRAILIEWMMGIVVSFQMLPDTLYLAVNILDRFLSKYAIPHLRLLQGYGLACTFIASKFCETNPPQLRNLLFVADNTYTRRQILSMENQILNELEFELCSVQSFDFIEQFLKACDCENSDRVRNLAYYVCEVQLQNEKALGFSRSDIALCSVMIALHISGRPYHKLYNFVFLSPQFYTTGIRTQADIFMLEQVNSCSQVMFDYLNKMQQGVITQSYVKQKYAHASFFGVGLVTLPGLAPFLR